MTLHSVSAGTCCQKCNVIAWGGENWFAGRLGIFCRGCWEMWRAR